MKKWMVIPLFLVFCLLAGAALAASFSDDPAAINQAALSVMKLEIYDENRDLIATGSGFVAFDNRHLVTNFHVVEDSYQVAAYNDAGEKYILKGVAIADRDKDIAIMEFYSPTDIPPLELNVTGEVLRASKVVAIGSPKGFKNTISTGIVSGVFVEDGVSMIQITAPISHGSSGGALFDDTGKVIGVTSASYAEGQNLNFAINISEVIGLYNTWDQSETALTQPAAADSVLPENRGFSMSIFTDYPKVFSVDVNKEEDVAFIESTSEGKDLAFTHRYESENFYSLAYPDILVINYSDESKQFPVLRIWIRYRGTKQLNLHSAEFVLSDGSSFTVSEIASSDRVYQKDDGSFAEDLLIRFGTNNMPLLQALAPASVDYVYNAYSDEGDPSAPAPAIRLILHGDEDLEVKLADLFWRDLGIFCVTMPQDPAESFVKENEGNPCTESLWGL